MEQNDGGELVFLFKEIVKKSLQKEVQEMQKKVDLADLSSGAIFRCTAKRRGKYTIIKSWFSKRI